MSDAGVLLFCDEAQELFLPWWYSHYEKTNDAPIAIIDLGLSERGKKWANNIGQVIAMEPVEFELEPPPDFIMDEWKHYTKADYERARPLWLTTPFALLKTPFEKTLYLDLDCEVRKNLDHLFDIPFGVVPAPEDTLKCWIERGISMPEQRRYNLGVIAYHKNSPIIQAWADMILDSSCHFWSDHEALMETLREKEFTVIELPEHYNTYSTQSISDETAIVHHLMLKGKLHILSEMIQTCLTTGF